MFSSTYDSNPFPNFPSSSSSSSYPNNNNNNNNTLPFYIDPHHNNDFATTLFHHHHDPSSLLVSPFIPTSSELPFPSSAEEAVVVAAMLDQDAGCCYGATGGLIYGGGGGGGGVGGGGVPNLLSQKALGGSSSIGTKKDRHSKIHTSQGLRDRRVRLSSEIARKFFDLQDMLEFDKPSNTLEWLFTKSENAIKELARSKHSCSFSSAGEKCSCCESDQAGGGGGVVFEKSSMAGSSDSCSKGRNKLKWTQREDVCVQAKKESRDKARARARERTCYKMNNNNNNNGRVVTVQDLEDKTPAALQQFEPSCASGRWPNNPHHMLQQQQQPYYNPHAFINNVIDESIMIKRNMNRDQNLISIPSNNNNSIIVDDDEYQNHSSSFLYSTPSWDTNETINGCSNFRAMAATMNNLSTCFTDQ